MGAEPGPGRGCLDLPAAGPLAYIGWPVWRCWPFGEPGLWEWLAVSGPGSGYTRIEETPGSLFANMRQSPEEISRLERNAHYYKLMGQPELGLKEMELAHQQNPDNLQITDLLAQNYEELGKFEAARQLYQEALTRQGPNAVLANNLCFSYYNEGRWQEAETCFRQTLTHDPGNVAARNNLGLLYCRLGRQDEAHRLWQEAEGVAAADAKMSQALAVLGMPESAVYAARKPDPTPPVARATQAPTPKAAASRLPAAIPAKPDTPAQPVTPKVSAAQLAAKPPAPKPVPVEAGPRPEAPKQAVVAQKAPAAATPAPAAPGGGPDLSGPSDRRRYPRGRQDRGGTARRRPPGTSGSEPGQGRARAAALSAQIRGSCGPVPHLTGANAPDRRRTGGHGHRGQERHLD